MFGGMAPVASDRLPGVLNINFQPLGHNTARNIAVKVAEFGDANSAFSVLEAFFLEVEPSKRFGLKVPIFFEQIDDSVIRKFNRYKDRNVDRFFA